MGIIQQMVHQKSYTVVVISLFIFFFIVNTLYLHRVPGLMGDEGSEGENIFQILDTKEFTVQGERSYIGPLIDYIRIPFILLFGYTPLSLRIVVVIFSLATFWLGWYVFRRLWGDIPALFALVFFTFSPIYLTQQRIGWAITLFPFFGLLILFLAQTSLSRKWLFVGLVAGIGLANHIVFLPTLVAIGVTGSIALIIHALQSRSVEKRNPQTQIKTIIYSVIESLVGFAAGFGTQLAVLILKTEDQGNPEVVAELFSQRLSDLLPALPLYLSGSSYVARYTGAEFSNSLVQLITGALIVGVVLALVFLWKRKGVWLWLLGILIHIPALIYMVDRFTLRYFVVLTLAIWIMAGVGYGAVVQKLLQHRPVIVGIKALGVAILLMAWTTVTVLLPFLRTGGSVNDFSLGNRTDSAAALIDIRPLINCLRGKGPIFTENVHIWNRLQYLSHQYGDLEVLPEEEGAQAAWIIYYREPKAPGGTTPGDLCPELVHFRVEMAQ